MSGLICLLFYISCWSPAEESNQRIYQFEENVFKDKIELAPGISINSESAGYTLILPEQDAIGMVVSFHSGRDTSHPGFEQRLYVPVTKAGLASLYVTSGNPFEFLFDSIRFDQLDKYIADARNSYSIPNQLFFVGMSLAGTRAMKFGKWCLEGNSKYNNLPKGIAVCDAPLDFNRFWQSGNEATHPTSISEAKWVNYQLESNLGGSPDQAPEVYKRFSPFNLEEDLSGELLIWLNTPLRFYTEPDTNWWAENRNKTIEQTNSIDASRFYEALIEVDHSNAELIITEGKGFHPDGRRHPHSWSIVDNHELVDWFIGILDQ